MLLLTNRIYGEDRKARQRQAPTNILEIKYFLNIDMNRGVTKEHLHGKYVSENTGFDGVKILRYHMHVKNNVLCVI